MSPSLTVKVNLRVFVLVAIGQQRLDHVAGANHLARFLILYIIMDNQSG